MKKLLIVGAWVVCLQTSMCIARESQPLFVPSECQNVAQAVLEESAKACAEVASPYVDENVRMKKLVRRLVSLLQKQEAEIRRLKEVLKTKDGQFAI